MGGFRFPCGVLLLTGLSISIKLHPCTYPTLASIQPTAGQPLISDCYGAPLTFSGGSSDIVSLANIGMAYRWGGRAAVGSSA